MSVQEHVTQSVYLFISGWNLQMQEASMPEAAVQVQGARQGQLLSEVRGQQGGGENIID